jgi:hypothetical protein
VGGCTTRRSRIADVAGRTTSARTSSTRSAIRGTAASPEPRDRVYEFASGWRTPHVSGWTDGMLNARAKLIAENIRRIACQEEPLNLIAP